MFIGIVIFLLTLTIILFPIPLKITLKYTNKVLEIYIYNKKLRTNKVSKNDIEHIPNLKPFRVFNLSEIKLIIGKLKHLKLKPTLTLKTKLEYGFNDAAFVAILFGLIHSTHSLLYLVLRDFVKVKNIDLKVIPHFEENDFNMETLSIIYMNLVKIIYMAFVMSICLIKIKHRKSSLKKYKGGSVHG